MDELIDFMQTTSTHCYTEAYYELLRNIQMCEGVHNNTYNDNINEVAIRLRNINTTYGNDIIFDVEYYRNLNHGIEDYLEYIRFLNFLLWQYWETIRENPTDLQRQIELSLRLYREFREGLDDYNYKVYHTSSLRGSQRPYFFRATNNY